MRGQATVLAVFLAAALALPTTAAPRKAAESKPPAVEPAVKARIAALVLRRVDFGGISLIPVRFENSRLAGPFDDGGRTTYCVTAQMHGRSFGKAERARAIVRRERTAQGEQLRAEAYDADVCAGERTEPFPELDGAPNRAQ
jgi:hypothetical protein